MTCFFINQLEQNYHIDITETVFCFVIFYRIKKSGHVDIEYKAFREKGERGKEREKEREAFFRKV